MLGISVYNFALILILMGLGVILITFWIWMIVDCIKRNEGYIRYVWTIILILTNFIGALIYFFTVRRKQISEE